MTVYENDRPDQNDPGNQSEAPAGAGKKKKKKAAKPSLFSRIRHAFTPKITVWLITLAGDDGSVLYAAPTKKDAFLAADALAFRHFFPHYSSWLKFHGYGNPEASDMSLYGIKSDAWREYLSTNIDAADEYLSTLEIRRATYDRLAFSSIVRIMCGAAPLGLDFETTAEIEYWLSEATAAITEKKNNEKTHEEETKEKEEGKSSAPLDSNTGKDHNVTGQGNGAGTKRRPGRPRKKGGSAQKTPGTKKGDSNEN